MVGRGMDGIGMAETGAVVTGMDAIGTTGTTGTPTTITSSSSATSDFHGGGAGVGAVAGVGAILTGVTLTMDTMMVIRTALVTDMDMEIPATAMAITGTETAMDMATAEAVNPALLPGRG